MAESVRELAGAPAEVLASLRGTLEGAGWQTLECCGPLLVVQRDHDRARVTILGSLHGTLVCIEGSRRAVAAVRALLPAETAARAPIVRHHPGGMALVACALIGAVLLVSLALLSPRLGHHDAGGTPAAPASENVLPLPAADSVAAAGPLEPQPTPPPVTPEDLVRQFYTFLDQKAFDLAYGLLSQRYRQARPFEAFRGGYRTTRGIRIDQLSQIDDSPQVQVRITATDLLDGQPMVRRYEGRWVLVKEEGQWYLDRGLVSPQP